MKDMYIRTTALALLGIVILLGACAPQSEKEKKEKTRAKIEELRGKQAKLADEIRLLEEQLGPGAEAVRSKVVSAQELKPRPFDHYIETQGTIYSRNNILVSAKSPGVITHVYVVEGDQVKEGQVLAQIDNTLLQRNIEELKSGLELAKTVYERQKNLWDQKIGTEVQYLQAKNTKENLEKRLATLNEQSDMSRIKSPIAGTVDDVRLRVGENIAPGLAAVRIVSPTNLKVKASFSESFVSTIKKGNRVAVSFPSLNKTVDAKVSFVGRTIDPLSRTFEVEVELVSQADLRPNMTALIRVIYDSYASALVVPVNVVQSINGESVVYVAETANGKSVARRKTIVVDGVYDNLAQVVKGLQTGDQVITVGYQGLNDGDSIKL